MSILGVQDMISKEERTGKGGFDAAFVSYTSRVHVLRAALKQALPNIDS